MMTRGISGESFQPDPKYSSLEAICARRLAFAQKLGQGAFAYCNEALEVIDGPEHLSPRQKETDSKDLL